MSFNKFFELDLDDLDIIEAALRSQLSTANPERQQLINNLLGRIHQQKQWYRPKDGPYISG